MKSAKTIAINGIIAALYIALTLITPFSFGVINVRLSDVIPAIGCIDKRYRWGVTVGMILANLFSPYGLVDVCVAVLICFCAFFLGGQKVEIRAVILIFATATWDMALITSALASCHPCFIHWASAPLVLFLEHIMLF